MMKNMAEIMKMMETSIFEVFEKMYFISLEPDELENAEYAMEASIDFGGSVRGNLTILFSNQISEAMVQNMLSLKKSEITDQEIKDCLKETANMVCGNMLTKFDSTQKFELKIPVFFKPVNMDFADHDHRERLAFISNEGNLGVVLSAT